MNYNIAVLLTFLVVVIFLSGCSTPNPGGQPGGTITPTHPVVLTPAPSTKSTLVMPVTLSSGQNEGIHKIKHVIIIMQENRAFDEYFGTYPGADGIPMNNGVPTVCNPDPMTGQCVRPYHDPNDINYGGPHGQYDSEADINGGKMDGFIEQAENAVNNSCHNANAHPG